MNNAVGLETLSPAMSQVSNYFDWVFATMKPHLGSRVLEVGPGFGNLGERLMRSSCAYFAVDSDAHVIDALRQRLPLSSKDQAVAGDVKDPAVIRRIEAWAPDTVVSMNVLEHVENDQALFDALIRFPSIQSIIVFVPAFQFLYGSMDRQAGHYRRYSRAGLSALLAKGGIRNPEVRYFNGLGAMAWLVAGRLLKLQMDSEKTNTSITHFDRFVIPIARLLDPVLSLGFGQSLYAFAENPRFNPKASAPAPSSI